MRRVTSLLAVLILVVAACSGAAAPECVRIADDTISMLQDMVTAVEPLPGPGPAGLDRAEVGSECPRHEYFL